MDLNTPIISKIIDNWIDEDIGRGDLTSSSITEENGNAYWIAKEEGIFCGVEIIKEIFRKIDLKISPKFNISDGCLLYTSPSPRDATLSRMPSSA